MKQRTDRKRHGYRYVTRPGDDPARVLHHLLHEAIKLTAESASTGRSVDLGSLRTRDIAAPWSDDPSCHEIVWEFDTYVVEEHE